MEFKSEKEMAELFTQFLQSSIKENNSNIEVLEEVKGLFGIPDCILIENNNKSMDYIISLELKLKNWKSALKQAFKYRSFSNESYVVMDEVSIKSVLKRVDLFIKSNIGLASFNKNIEFKVYYNPKKSKPFLNMFYKKIKNYLLLEEDKPVGTKKQLNNDNVKFDISKSNCLSSILSFYSV
jgi:hypothetical protein